MYHYAIFDVYYSKASNRKKILLTLTIARINRCTKHLDRLFVPLNKSRSLIKLNAIQMPVFFDRS